MIKVILSREGIPLLFKLNDFSKPDGMVRRMEGEDAGGREEEEEEETG